MTTKDANGESYFPADENGTVINNGEWKHVCLSYNNGAFVLYLNGNSNLTGTSTRYKNNATPTFRTFFGNRWNRNEGSSVLIGAMDQIRVFNTAISSGNAATLAAETYASATKSTTDIFGNGSGTSLYQLEDNANDTGVAIDSGQSGVFNGTNSEISLGSSNSFSYTTTGALSINMWIKTTNISTAYVISKANDSSGQYEWAIEQLSNGTLSLHAYTNAGGFASSINNTTIINDGNWHNVVGVIVNNTSTTLYIDRTSATSTSFSGTAASYSIPTLIGHFGGIPAATSFFEGGIDQVRIYSSALSAADVTNIYNETNIPTSNFLSWYKLDGNANDSKGSNNGTWSGSEAYSTPAIRNYKAQDIAINYLGMAFSPSLIWIKQRSGTRDHIMADTVRGGTGTYPNQTNFDLLYPYGSFAQDTNVGSEFIRSIQSNGFTIGNHVYVSEANQTYVAWCWKAGGAAVSNTDGTISSQVSANKAAGFSIVKWTGDGSNKTIGHGLTDLTPKLIFYKSLTANQSWTVLTTIIDGSVDGLNLDTNAIKFNISAAGASPTSSVFGNVGFPTEMIGYVFADISGYQKVGTYQGNAASLQTIVTGFQVRFVLIKAYDGTTNWEIFDSVRGGNKGLQPNVDTAEFSSGSNFVSFLSNGFEVSSINHENTNGKNYIYLAIA